MTPDVNGGAERSWCAMARVVCASPRKRVYNRAILCVYLCVRGPVAAAPQLSQRCREEATRTTRRGGLRLSASLRWIPQRKITNILHILSEHRIGNTIVPENSVHSGTVLVSRNSGLPRLAACKSGVTSQRCVQLNVHGSYPRNGVFSAAKWS